MPYRKKTSSGWGSCFVVCIALSPPLGVRRVELSDTLEGYFRTLQERGVQPALTTKSLRERALQVALKLRENSAATLVSQRRASLERHR